FLCWPSHDTEPSLKNSWYGPFFSLPSAPSLLLSVFIPYLRTCRSSNPARHGGFRQDTRWIAGAAAPALSKRAKLAAHATRLTSGAAGSTREYAHRAGITRPTRARRR